MRVVATAAAAAAIGVLGARPWRLRLTLPPAANLIPAAVGAVGGWTIATTIGIPTAAALGVALAGAALPGARRHRRRERDLRRDTARWPDFLAAVRARLATGAAIPSACADAARHVGGRFLVLAAPPGVPFATILAAARTAWDDPLADRILTTLELANAVGGTQVSAVLGALTASIADDLRLRRAHDAALTEQRLTAAVALIAPWAILLLSVATNPTASEAFSRTAGERIIAGGLVATAAGYALARRSARLSRPPRLFS